MSNIHSLSSIFAETDNVSYGAYKITKPTGSNYKSARFLVGDQEVTLLPAQKKIMALLISQQGEPLTWAGFAREIPKWAGDAPDEESILGFEQEAQRKLITLYKVQISLIKKSIKAQLGNNEVTGIQIEPLTHQGQKPHDNNPAFGYRLLSL